MAQEAVRRQYAAGSTEIVYVDAEKVLDNPYQPRHFYPPKKVDELASSIEQIGILHIPVGRRQGDDIQLAYGHVRKRAFIKLKKRNPKKFSTMPVEVKNLDDRQMAVFALEENMKRTDITPIDMARSVTQYLEIFKDATETALAEKLSMTQGNISNMRRVMRLPKEVLDKVDEGRISFTMARELCVLEGVSAPGYETVWSRKDRTSTKIPKDSRWLMLQAIKSIATPENPGSGYNTRYPATVDGMQKAIHDALKSTLNPLGKESEYGYRYSGDELLFDPKAAGCDKCEHTLKTHPTKSMVCSWCTDQKCWKKHQAEHKEKAAAKTKAAMQQDVLARVAAAEKERQDKPISQEIPADNVDAVPAASTAPVATPPAAQAVQVPQGDQPEDEIVNYILPEERERARKRLAELKKHPDRVICLSCLNVGRCDGACFYATEDGFACNSHMGKEDAPKVREKATISVPPELQELAKEKAGTRAEIFDLHELRAGNWGLKEGYVDITGVQEMDQTECLTTCIKGFHFAFDSEIRPYAPAERGKTHHICTNPKCVGQKKAAYTRARNAAGAEKKKAEFAAIRKVVDETTAVDKPRLLVLLFTLINSTAGFYSGIADRNLNWFVDKLKVPRDSIKNNWNSGMDSDKARKAVIEAAEKLEELPLAKLILESCFLAVTFNGDLKNYKALATPLLNWCGAGIQVRKKKGDNED